MCQQVLGWIFHLGGMRKVGSCGPQSKFVNELGVTFSVGRDEGGLVSSLDFSLGLGLGDTVQQCSGEEGGGMVFC